MSLREIDWFEILNSIGRHASSRRGKEKIRRLGPFATPSEALHSMDEIATVQKIAKEDIPNFSTIDDMPPIIERLDQKGVLDVKQILAAKASFETAAWTKSILKPLKGTWIETQKNLLSDFKSELSAINHVVTPQGEISEDASPQLRSLCDEKRKLTVELARTLDHIVARRQLGPVLQDKYVTTREGRLVVPVKSGSQHDLKGIIHDRSQTKQTVFMEPEEAVPLNNRLRQVLIEIEEEIQRILRELSDYLARQLLVIRNSDQVLELLDVCFAKAGFSTLVKAQKPDFSESGEIHLPELRHPLLVQQDLEVVANTVNLDRTKRILLLSGPNAGGKTVLLKSLGLAAAMASHGLPICTEPEARLPFFKKIDPVIGDLQSVEENLSTFSSHVKRLNQTLELKGPQVLVLVDEICGATDPEEGGALARSIIHQYAENEIFAAVTSHFGSLKDGWQDLKCVLQGSLEFDRIHNKPTYQLVLGIPGRSLALSMAKRLGMPDKILERAQSFMSPEFRKKASNLSEIEEIKEQMLKLKDAASKEKLEASRLKANYQELIKRFREQRDKWLEKSLEKAQGKIERLIEDARQQRLKDRTLMDLKSELPEVVKARSGSRLRPQTIEEFRAQFPPGTPAISSRLGQNVVIQSEPDSKGQVMVLAGSMRVQLPWHTLSHLSQEPKVTEDRPIIRKKHVSVDAPTDTRDELDLRGFRVDEALSRLEKWIDHCVRSEKDRVKVIHGFGTEQLKKAIRQFLSKNDMVSRWTAGDTQTGGDGVTWIYF